MKLLKVYHWYVKILQCGYTVKIGSKDIKCYVQKHIAPQAICYKPISSWQAARSTGILLLLLTHTLISMVAWLNNHRI